MVKTDVLKSNSTSFFINWELHQITNKYLFNIYLVLVYPSYTYVFNAMRNFPAYFRWDRQSTLWKYKKFTLTEKIFRQITYLVISLVKLLLSRNFCQKCMRGNFRNFHTVPLRYAIMRNQILFLKTIFRQSDF